jgi:hypothetical protein
MNALTLVLKIKEDRREKLTEVLKQINRDPGHNPYMRLTEGKRTHCIRCAVIHDDDNGYRLLVATEYDGTLHEYVNEWLLISPQLDALWGNCEGYEGREKFEEFIRQNGHETQAFYIAFRNETVQTIKHKATVRNHLEEFLDKNRKEIEPVLYVLSNLPPAFAPLKRIRQRLRAWLSELRSNALSMMLLVIEPIAQLGQTKNYPKVTSVCPSSREQNSLAPTAFDGQMITITEVKRGRYLRLRLSMAANEFLGKYWYPPGLFAYVGTLYSFRWVLIDKKKRLIFLSVFDGSWQNYMGDFIDKIVWALDGVYNNTKGYPPGGMAEVPPFQRWILQHQYEPQLFYKAYPEESVMKLVRDRDINYKLGSILETRFDSADVKGILQDL